MKQPIEPSDIRKGDLIRIEYPTGAINSAVEYVAGGPARVDDYLPGSAHYLLDRPKPAVELPTEPTLGWVEYSFDGDSIRRLGCSYNLGRIARLVKWDIEVPASRVTAFSSATAVPTAALDELRRVHGHPNRDDRAVRRQVNRLLAAADEANR